MVSEFLTSVLTFLSTYDWRFYAILFFLLSTIVKVITMFLKRKGKPMKSFVDEVVLVTGGADGIGRKLVELFLFEGATVIVWDIHTYFVSQMVKELRMQFGIDKVFGYTVDVTDKDRVYEVAENVNSAEFGPVTVLINNAGVHPNYSPKTRSILNVSDEEIERVYKVNVLAHYWTIKAFLPDMIRNNHGHICCLSSMGALFGDRGMPVYSPTKAAVFNLTESVGLRQKIKQRNIDFTIVCPNPVDTELTKKFMESVNVNYEKMKEKLYSVDEIGERIIKGMKLRENVVMIPKMFGKLVYFRRILGFPPYPAKSIVKKTIREGERRN